MTTALQDRIAAGSGQDRKLDEEIFEHFNGKGSWRTNYLGHTTSLGACMTLVEQECPRKDLWTWHMHNRAYVDGVSQGDDMQMFVIVHPVSSGGGPKWAGIHEDLCRAILLALLRAQEAEG